MVSHLADRSGVDVDFPIAYRGGGGVGFYYADSGPLQSGGKAAGRGERCSGVSPDGETCGYDRQNIAAARQVLRKHQDPASPDAIGNFQFYRTLKGRRRWTRNRFWICSGGDTRAAVSPLPRWPWRFRLIESPTVPFTSPLGMGRGWWSSCGKGVGARAFRALGQYVVNVYPSTTKLF